VSAYGATTAENDFNTYAEKIFTEPKALVLLACNHALIRKKLLFVLRTYVSLDARMENVFRELGIDREHLCGHQSRRQWWFEPEPPRSRGATIGAFNAKIIDLTLATTMAIAQGRPEQGGGVVMGHANSFKGFACRPIVVGSDFLLRIGT
jgi:hypothetical protein